MNSVSTSTRGSERLSRDWRRFGAGIGLAMAMLGVATPALALSAISAVSPVVPVISPIDSRTSPVKGSDGSFDPSNQVFLIVSTCYNQGTCPAGLGQVYG